MNSYKGHAPTHSHTRTHPLTHTHMQRNAHKYDNPLGCIHMQKHVGEASGEGEGGSERQPLHLGAGLDSLTNKCQFAGMSDG